jgi:hypothetical protein
MHRHVVWQRRHVLVEPVPPGDLERHQPHLPRPGRNGQWTFDPAHLQHVDGAGAQGHGPPDRDRVDQAAVEVVLPADLDRRQQPGHRTRGHHRGYHRPAGKPARGRVLDAGRHALEGQLEVGEVLPGQDARQQPAQPLQRVQVGPRTQQPHRPAPQSLAEGQPQLVTFPHLPEPDRRAGRVRRHQRAVDGADRRTHDEVGPDAGLRQRLQHADLVRAEQPPAAEHERRRHPPSLTSPRESQRPPRPGHQVPRALAQIRHTLAPFT